MPKVFLLTAFLAALEFCQNPRRIHVSSEQRQSKDMSTVTWIEVEKCYKKA